MKPIVVHPSARAELLAAAAIYEEQRPGLGFDFQSEVEATFRRIQQNPQIYSPYSKRGFRMCFVNRFSYTIYYLERDSDIWVAAIAHQRRRPGYWTRRKPD